MSGAMPRDGDDRAWRLRWHLALLSAVLVLPILAAAVAVGLATAGAERSRLEGEARAEARRLVRDVDAEAAAALGALAAVAAALPAGDAEAMLRHVEAVRRSTGLQLLLRGADGAPLEGDVGPDGLGGCPAVAPAPVPHRLSGLLTCPGALEPFVLAAVPVPAPAWAADGGRDSGAATLAMRLPVSVLRAVLTRHEASRAPTRRDDGRAPGPALVDRDGTVLARWRDHDRLVGRPMPAEARDAVLAAPEGIWRGTSLAGRPVLVAHAVSPLSGWAVGLGVPQEMLAAPMRRSLLALAPLAGALVALAALGTALVARRIERPVAGLADLAAALGRGEAPAAPRTPVAEVNAAGAALARAGRARREAEDARRLLLMEMQHRVKNILATVQSIATLSARDAASPEAFARGFGARLRAIAQTHALLLADGASAAPLRAILAGELAPYGAEAGGPEGAGRVRLSGPDLPLPAEAAQALGLVAHELATNAAKHGALSREDGRVDVAWAVEGRGDGRRLALDWTETGGPPVAAPPARTGFGSRLVAQALGGRLGGCVAFDWRPEGLRARLEVSISGSDLPRVNEGSATVCKTSSRSRK